MKMDSKKMKALLEKRLQSESRTITYDRKNDLLRIESKESGRGITVELPRIIAKWEVDKEKAVDEVVYYVEEGLKAMDEKTTQEGEKTRIFPVIRSTSTPVVSREEIPLVFDDHTAETRVYYALDLGNAYRIIDEALMTKENWTRDYIREVALFNVRSLKTTMKRDEVAGNTFYFLNTNDGYDASRILNDSFLKEMSSKITGDMAIAVPHQDVLILADIQNETGYDILAQMTMSFFASGRVPITALSFLYENGELEPIFILGKNRSKKPN